MSLTSYQAAPPRVLLETQTASVFEMRNLISEVFRAARNREGASMLAPWRRGTLVFDLSQTLVSGGFAIIATARVNVDPRRRGNERAAGRTIISD
jgi:hypothetical protein